MCYIVDEHWKSFLSEIKLPQKAMHEPVLNTPGEGGIWLQILPRKLMRLCLKN